MTRYMKSFTVRAYPLADNVARCLLHLKPGVAASQAIYTLTANHGGAAPEAAVLLP